MKKITAFGTMAVALLVVHFAAAQGAEDLAWPRSVKVGADTLTIYQPQIEQWNGAEIACQAAVSVQTGEEPPVYGVARLSAKAEIDKAARTAAIQNFQLARVTFATAPEKDAAYLDDFRRLLPAGAKTVALDKLESSLALTDTVKRQLALNLKGEGPAIIFTTVPTILILVDGQPVLQPMAGLDVERVLNARALIVKLNGLFYLTALNYWYEAAAIEGPWAPTDEPPAILARVKQAAAATRQVDLMESAAAVPRTEPPPALHVSTVPAELIQTAGPPQMLPVEGTFLLRVRNTRDCIFVDLNTNLHYAQISGRWYRTKSPYYGPWESVPADRLPADFAKIPLASEPPGPPVATAQPKFPPPSAIVTPPPSDSYVIQQPPPPPIEVIPACPGPDYVWTGGYWDWGPGGWIWIGGRWGIGLDFGPIGVWFGGGHGHFGHGHFGHGWGGHRH